ncbi:MAG: nuclear transport factor 2 family protein [Acidobacteriota bacterium]
MADHATLDQQLNAAILEGKILEAFEEHYADEVVMIEGGGERHEGKDVNREREQQFVGSLQEVHEVALHAAAVDGDISLSEWLMDVTFQDGTRKRLEQAAVRRWRDGKIVEERFYYDAAS